MQYWLLGSTKCTTLKGKLCYKMNKCIICHEENLAVRNTDCVGKGACRFYAHEKCILSWYLFSSDTCPICHYKLNRIASNNLEVAVSENPETNIDVADSNPSEDSVERLIRYVATLLIILSCGTIIGTFVNAAV